MLLSKINIKPARKWLVIAVAAVVFTGILIWFNASVHRVPLRPTGGAEFATAKVTRVISSEVNESAYGERSGNQVVTLRLLSGRFKGQTVEAKSPYANNSGAYCVPGMRVIALVNKGTDGSLVASVYNYDRGPVLWILIGLFFAALCLIGGKKGAFSSVALAFTFVCIIFLYVPMLYAGASPLGAAVLVSVLITVVTMLLVGGWSRKSLCAILGTVAGVLLAGCIALVFGRAANISGVNVEEIENLTLIAQNSRLNVSELLFSGILIASLGAVLDISMSIASTVSELHENSREMTRGQLFRSGMAVGKDMMGTMATTLILAFAGTSVNTLVIIYSYSLSYLQFMNQYTIGIEILSSFSGSLGVILAVPLVSFLSALMMTSKRPLALLQKNDAP